jgi:hypothetical protein
MVVLDEAIGEIHGRGPRLPGQEEAARRMEVDGVGRGEPEVARLVGESARWHAMGPGEGTRERLDRVVAGLEAGLGDAGATAEAPGGAFQQQAAPERCRRLADAGAHQAIEVERAEHRTRRQRRSAEALVESLEHGVDDVAQAIRPHRFHGPGVCPHPPPTGMTGIAAARWDLRTLGRSPSRSRTTC